MNSNANNLPDSLDPLLREPAVKELTALSKSQRWRMIAAGTFPRPLKLSTRVSAWRTSDIRRWMESLGNGDRRAVQERRT